LPVNCYNTPETKEGANDEMGKKAVGKQGGKKSGASSGKPVPKRNSLFSAGTIGIIIVVIAVVAIVGFLEYNRVATPPGVPSGNVCQENINYLQAGVDRYRAAFGVYPTSLEQLLETRDGAGPFVETVNLRCPSSGRPYIVDNGRVRDS
jgi:hypothetical protein